MKTEMNSPYEKKKKKKKKNVKAEDNENLLVVTLLDPHFRKSFSVMQQ